MSSSAVVPFVVTAPNVVHLHDSDIDTLIDLRLFGHGAWCQGAYEYSVLRCSLCGSTENWGLAAQIFGDPHLRSVPAYTGDWLVTWLVIREIKERGIEMLRAFMAHLSVLMAAEGKSMSAVTYMTRRMIAVAALQAIGAVDTAGYIIARREGVQ